MKHPPPYSGYTIDRVLAPEGYYLVRLYRDEIRDLLSERQYQEVIVWLWEFCKALTDGGEPTAMEIYPGFPVASGLT